MGEPTRNLGPNNLAVLTFIGYKQTIYTSNKYIDTYNIPP